MERLRASLSLQIPSALLPSTRAPGLPDSDSQQSLEEEEEGLVLRPVSAYGRSTSGPAAAAVGRQPAPAPAGPPHRSATFPAGTKPAAATVAVRVDAAGSAAPPQQGCSAAAEQAPAAERVGSRQPELGIAVGGAAAATRAGQAPAAPSSLPSEPSTAAAPSARGASHGALSPVPPSERYSEEFEADDDSRSQAPSASSPGAASSTAAAPSLARLAARPASAAVGRVGAGVSPARSPSARHLSRSGSARPGYLAPTAAIEAKRAAPPASAPGSRPGSASPSKQPAQCAAAGEQGAGWDGMLSSAANHRPCCAAGGRAGGAQAA